MRNPIEVIHASRRDLFKYTGAGAVAIAQGYNPQFLDAPFTYQVVAEDKRQLLSVATQSVTNPHLYRGTDSIADNLVVGILFVPDKPGIRISSTWQDDLSGTLGEAAAFYRQQVSNSRWSLALRIIHGDRTIDKYTSVQEIDAEIKSKLKGDIVMPNPLAHLIRNSYIGCSLLDLYNSPIWKLFGGGLDADRDGFVVDAKYFADFKKQGFTYGTIRAAQGFAFALGMMQPWMDIILNPSKDRSYGNDVGNLFYRGYAPVETNFRLNLAYIMKEQKDLLGASYRRALFPSIPLQAQSTQQQ